MKKISFIILAGLATNPLLPAFADAYYVQAKVVSVTPQYERINSPREECHTEYVTKVYQNERPSAAGSIIGGIAGGLLGSTIGKGNGRVAAAAVGAGIGAVVGDRADNQNNSTQTVQHPVQRCVMIDSWHTVQHGYLVTYQYNGQTFKTITDKRPTDTIRVRIAVTPAAEITEYNAPISYHAPVTNHNFPPTVYVDRPYFDGLYLDLNWSNRGRGGHHSDHRHH